MNIIKKIWKVSSKKIKVFLLIYTCVAIINSLIEVLSILALLPFLQFLLEKNLGSSGFLNYFNFFKTLEIGDNYTTFLFIFLIFIYLAKLIFNFLNLFYNQKLLFEYRKYLPKFLMGKYIAKNFNFFLKKNSSQLLKNVTTETSNVIVGCVGMILALISDFTLVFLSVSALLIFNFETTLFVLFFLLFLAALYLSLSRKFVAAAGENRKFFDTLKFTTLSNIFDNVKLIKILNKETYFLNFFSNINNSWAKSHLKFNIIAQLPRLLFEFLVIFSIIIVTAFLFRSAESGIIYLLALYVLIAIRLIPSISKIISAFQNIKFNSPALDVLTEEFFENRAESISINAYELPNVNSLTRFENLVEFSDVFFSHSGKAQVILENINITIKKNDFIGVIGETGSGKSTFVDLLSGLIQPTSGKIIVDNNFIISEKNQKIWQKNIGYLPQNITVLDGTIRDNIAFGCNEAEIDNRKIEKVIESAALSDFVAKRSGGIFSEIGQGGKLMSGGEKQRLAIARTLYFEPEFLILDECTSSLDVDTEFEILNILMKLESKTVVFITHRKHNLKNCSKIYEVKEKRILLKTINEIF